MPSFENVRKRLRGHFRPLRPLIVAATFGILGLTSATAQAEIKVGYSDWPGWVAWAIAEQQGFFKKHGASVKLVWFPNYSDSISALRAKVSHTGMSACASPAASPAHGPNQRRAKTSARKRRV